MATMYKITPILKTSARDITLPSCMYKMPYLYEEFDDVKVEPKKLSQEEQQKVQDQMRSILNRQEELITALAKLESVLGVSDSTNNGSKFTVTNLSSDERVLRQLIERQERLIKDLCVLEKDVSRLVGEAVASVDSGAAQTSTSKAPPSNRPRDICIQADIGSPPQQVRKLIEQIGRQSNNKKILLQTLYHSSTAGLKRPTDWSDLTDENVLTRANYDQTFTVVLKKGIDQTTLIVNPLEPAANIRGESNVVKHLSEQFKCS